MKGLTEAAVMALAIFASATSSYAAVTPIEGITGWNRDIVVEVGPQETARDRVTDGREGGFDTGAHTTYYEKGFMDQPAGLPNDRLLANGAYQLQPYSQNNVLALFTNSSYVPNSSPTGTLSLTTAQAYNMLSVVAASHHGGGLGTVVINFEGGLTYQTTFNAYSHFDLSTGTWMDDITVATRLGRYNLVREAHEFTGSPATKLYKTDIDLTNVLVDGILATALKVESLTFTVPTEGGEGEIHWPTYGGSAIFAISGEAVPEPASAGLLMLGGLLLMARRS